MNAGQIVGASVIALAFIAGCDREDASRAPSTPSAATPSTLPATQPGAAALEVPSDVNRSASEIQAGADRAAAEAKGAVESTRDAARQATTQAQTQAAGAAQMTSDEAKKLLDQAVVYVKENKYDLAEKALNQVEAQKASLPKALQDQLAGARTALNAAKAGGGLKIPGLGSGDANK